MTVLSFWLLDAVNAKQQSLTIGAIVERKLTWDYETLQPTEPSWYFQPAGTKQLLTSSTNNVLK